MRQLSHMYKTEIKQLKPLPLRALQSMLSHVGPVSSEATNVFDQRSIQFLFSVKGPFNVFDQRSISRIQFQELPINGISFIPDDGLRISRSVEWKNVFYFNTVIQARPRPIKDSSVAQRLGNPAVECLNSILALSTGELWCFKAQLKSGACMTQRSICTRRLHVLWNQNALQERWSHQKKLVQHCHTKHFCSFLVFRNNPDV